MTIPMPDQGDAATPRPSRRPAPRWTDDQQLAATVVARLVADERTRDEPIAVEVQNRVVGVSVGAPPHQLPDQRDEIRGGC